MSEFKLLDRGAKTTILLIPGWASDYRVFNSLDIAKNYLIPVKFSPFDFDKSLLEAMNKNRLEKISIMGWSMGGFMAFDFLSRHKDKVDSITFVSIREKYEQGRIDEIVSYIKKNRTGFLCKFYKDCFSKEEENELSRFKKELMKSYLNEISLEALLEGLDYLSKSRITSQILNGVKVRFIHGEEDRIAPIKEVQRLKNNLPGAELVTMKVTGHMPFLKHGFKEIFND